ncbi:putative lipoprotein [Tanacetum coccineum]
MVEAPVVIMTGARGIGKGDAAISTCAYWYLMIEKLQVEKWVDPKNGHPTRKINHHDSLLRAVQTLRDRSMVNDVVASDVDSVILPADACGGNSALAFANKKPRQPLIICVQGNETVLNDTPEKLRIDVVSNYWEAIGVVAAYNTGVDPNSLRRDKIKNLTANPLICSNGSVASSTRTFALLLARYFVIRKG